MMVYACTYRVQLQGFTGHCDRLQHQIQGAEHHQEEHRPPDHHVPLHFRSARIGGAL